MIIWSKLYYKFFIWAVVEVFNLYIVHILQLLNYFPQTFSQVFRRRLDIIILHLMTTEPI